MTDHFTDLSATPAGRNDAIPAPLNRNGWSFAVLIFAAQMLVVVLVVIGMAVSTYQQQARVILEDKQATVATISISLIRLPWPTTPSLAMHWPARIPQNCSSPIPTRFWTAGRVLILFRS